MSKLSDSDTENGKTQTWLAFDYISIVEHENLYQQSQQVAKLLVYVMNNHEKFLVKT